MSERIAELELEIAELDEQVDELQEKVAELEEEVEDLEHELHELKTAKELTTEKRLDAAESAARSIFTFAATHCTRAVLYDEWGNKIGEITESDARESIEEEFCDVQ